MTKVKITNAVRPPAPTERELSSVTMMFDTDLKCVRVKLEFMEVSGEEKIGWRTVLGDKDATDFYATWKLGAAAAIEAYLSRGDLRQERHG